MNNVKMNKRLSGAAWLTYFLAVGLIALTSGCAKSKSSVSVTYVNPVSVKCVSGDHVLLDVILDNKTKLAKSSGGDDEDESHSEIEDVVCTVTY